jgi:hypothetical protein
MVCAQEYLSLYFFNFTSFTKEAPWNEKSVWASSGSPTNKEFQIFESLYSFIELDTNQSRNEAIFNPIIKKHF